MHHIGIICHKIVIYDFFWGFQWNKWLKIKILNKYFDFKLECNAQLEFEHDLTSISYKVHFIQLKLDYQPWHYNRVQMINSSPISHL